MRVYRQCMCICNIYITKITSKLEVLMHQILVGVRLKSLNTHVSGVASVRLL